MKVSDGRWCERKRGGSTWAEREKGENVPYWQQTTFFSKMKSI
jgi:hypothetical protein